MVTSLIARGDDLTLPPFATSIPSPIDGVNADAWSRFVRALATKVVNGVPAARDLREVSPSGGLGWFEMRPRRLADLGLVTNLRRSTTPGGRQVWEGDFVLPLTRKRFLDNPVVQYNALVRSVTDHLAHVGDLPAGVSMSGALAILHRAGPGALRTWPSGKQFDDTLHLFHHANQIF